MITIYKKILFFKVKVAEYSNVHYSIVTGTNGILSIRDTRKRQDDGTIRESIAVFNKNQWTTAEDDRYE